MVTAAAAPTDDTRKKIASIIYQADKKYGIPKPGTEEFEKYIKTANKIASLMRLKFEEMYPDIYKDLKEAVRKEALKQNFMYIGD